LYLNSLTREKKVKSRHSIALKVEKIVYL